MSNLSRTVKLAVAAGLLALTGLAAGLTMSVVFNAQASTPASVSSSTNNANNSAVVASQSNSSAAATTDEANNQATNDEDGFDFNFDNTDPASMMQGMMQQMPAGMAQQIQAMAGPMGFGRGPEAQGAITKIDGNTFIISRNMTVTVNAQTKFGDSNGELTQSDLKVGDRVFVLGTVQSDKSVTARWMLRLPALPSIERGKFVAATGDKFTFTVGNNNDTWTATTTSSTQITKNGNKAALTDLAKDDVVSVVGKADSTNKTIAADQVIVGRPAVNPPVRGNGANGTVKSIDAANNSLVVTEKGRNGAADTDVKVTVDSNTRYLGQNVKSLSDLKAGDVVFVQGDKQSDGSIKAKVVAKGPAGRGGMMAGPGGPGGQQRGGKGPGGNNQPKATPTPNQ